MNVSKALFVAACAAATASAHAFTWTFNSVIDGFQEVPPTGSPATGLAVGTYDDVTNQLDLTITFSGLVGNETNAHIHKGAAGTNGGVVFQLPAGSPKNFSQVLSATQETDLLSSLYYVNIHSSVNPGGEIRGQLIPLPEPGTFIALGAGIAFLARKRKKAS